MDRVFTLGYEGRTLQELVGLLDRLGVRQVADVRENPWSRRPGLDRDTLARILEERGVGYRHFGALGCRFEARTALRRGGDFAPYAEAYREHLRGAERVVRDLEAFLREAPTAVLCTERRAEECHRLVLAERLAADGFRVEHV